MRPILIFACIALLLPVVVHAQAPPVGYLAIYADESQTVWCASGTPPYQIDMWVYLLFGENGAGAYSFDLEIPPNVEVVSMELNRFESPEMCLPPDCPEGIYGSFGICWMPPRFTSTWIVHATLDVLDANPSQVRIIANPGHGTIRVTDCSGVFETPRVWTNLYVNYEISAPECGALPTEPTTWGAVKSMYQTAE